MTVSRTRLWPCFGAGGALLGLGTALERVVHHAQAYGALSPALLHVCIAVLTAGLLGGLAGALLDALDVAVRSEELV